MYYFNNAPIPEPERYAGKSFKSGSHWFKVFLDQNFFEREKNVLEKVHGCQGIVKMLGSGTVRIVHEDGREEAYQAIKEEFTEGITFEQWSKSHHKEEEGLDLFISLAYILASLNNIGVLHNDINPGNVIVSDDGSARLIDFNIAKSEDDEVLDIHRSGRDGFAAPEKSSGLVSVRSDIYSFGCLMSYFKQMKPARMNITYSNSFLNIYKICCKENPSERYSSFDEVKQALTEARDKKKTNEQEKPAETGHAHAFKLPKINLGIKLMKLSTILLYSISFYLLGLGFYTVFRPVDKDPVQEYSGFPNPVKATKILVIDIRNYLNSK